MHWRRYRVHFHNNWCEWREEKRKESKVNG